MPDNLSILFSFQLVPSWKALSFSSLDWLYSRPPSEWSSGTVLYYYPGSPLCLPLGGAVGGGVPFFQILSFSFSCFTLLCWSTFSSSFLNRYVFEYFKILVSHLIYGWVKNFKLRSCSLWIFKTCLQLSSSSLCGYWDESYILGILPISPTPLETSKLLYSSFSHPLFLSSLPPCPLFFIVLARTPVRCWI